MYSDAEGGGGASTSDQYGFMSYAPQAAPQGLPQQTASWGSTPVDQIGGDDDEFANEPPLMQELGFDFTHIAAKVLGVLHPFKTLNDDIMADSDMAGPIAFALILGFCMLFSGKVHFGYIYGFGAMGTIGIYVIANLMSPAHPLDVARTFSILGYCLLPIVALAAFSILINLRGVVGTALGSAAVIWCTTSAARFFEAAMHMSHQKWLIAYPCFLLYACFALMAIF